METTSVRVYYVDNPKDTVWFITMLGSLEDQEAIACAQRAFTSEEGLEPGDGTILETEVSNGNIGIEVFRYVAYPPLR